MIWYNRDQDESQLSMRRGLCQARIILVLEAFEKMYGSIFTPSRFFLLLELKREIRNFPHMKIRQQKLSLSLFIRQNWTNWGRRRQQAQTRRVSLLTFFSYIFFQEKKLLVFLSSCHYFCLSHSSLFANCYTPIDSFSLF